MNAQGWWKLYYLKAMLAKREGAMSYMYELLCQAAYYRRPALLERKLAAAQRTIEAQAAEIERMQTVIDDLDGFSGSFAATMLLSKRPEYTNAETFGISEWDAETPFGHALDGGGDEVEV